MKKLIIGALCFAAVLAALPAFAATKTVTWSLPTDWEGNVELDPICEPVGAPSVAYYNALIEVPASATNFVITASDVAYRASELGRPAPVLEPSVVGEPVNEPVEDAALYAGVYPSDVFEKGEPWEAGGKTVLPVRIKVYRWNGPKNKVEALSSLKLSIACESPRATLKLTTSAVPTTKVDYIVISPHNYVGYWQKFIDYRKTTHPKMTFQIVDADDIYAKYTTGDDALRIHHFIEDMYNLGTRYILFGAGAQHTGYNNKTMIPTRICVTYNGNTQSCDYYYCVLDYKGGKEVWDYNGDGIYLASKNSSGGYTTDSTSQFTWQGKMMVHRFPARDTVSLGGKSRTAQQQIEGYVEKLKRAEKGLFGGRFSQAILGHQRSVETDTAQGNTSADCTMERQFYDLGANIFSAEHGKPIAGIELDTRARAYNYMTVKRPVGYNRSVLQFYYKNGETASTFYGRNFDAMLINAHGSPERVEPIEYAGVFNSTGLSVFHIMCVPCHAGNPCAGSNTEVSIAEAGVVNPDGGSLVTFGNSASGWYGGRDVMSQKIELNIVRQLYGITDGSFKDAGTARLYAQNNYGTPSPRNANGQVVANSMAYGDPLVALSPIWSRKIDSSGNWWYGTGYATPCEQEFASSLTVDANNGDQTITITNAIGAANLTINGTSGKTLTLAASDNGKFKVSNAVTVNNGMTLNWEVPGGFGRGGINLANGGNLRLLAEGYYGIDFKGIGTLTVAPPSGKTAIVDFDSKGYFRDGSGKFTALEVTGAGETIFRSRQAGIFSTGFTIPISGGGKLTLETPCVGGSGAQSATTPLFTLTGGATLSVRANPNWTAECFSRSVWLSGGTIDSSYDKFYFGPNGSSYPGLDIWVDGSENYFTGTYPICLNGKLRLHTRNGSGTLTANCELANGGVNGSIALDSGVTLKMAKSSSFSGGITVPSGARLVVDNAGGLGTGSVVVQSGGVLQMNAMPLTGVKSVTLQSGAKLVLKSTGGGSYQMYSPATTSFTMADDVKVYDSADEDTPLDGIVTPEGAYFISDAAKFWGNVSGKSWKNDATELAWKKKNVAEDLPYADGDTVLFKNIANESAVTVPVVGNVNPGMMAFQNSTTAYDFTGSGTITVGSMATAGTTKFAPAIRATSQVSVGGKTTVGNVTTPTLNVAGGGALQVTGTANGIDTIGSIRFNANETAGLPGWNAKLGALQLSELQFYDASNNLIYFPVDTVIKDSAGNSTKITGRSGGKYTFSTTSTLNNLFDGNCTTYHTVGNSLTGPYKITITLGSPIEMFKTFRYGYCQNFAIQDIYQRILSGHDNYPYSNPYGWQVAVGSNEASLQNVITRGAERDASWYAKLSPAFTASGAAATSKAVIRDGGTLYLSGTYNVPVTVNAGATLAVTNTSKATFNGTKSWPTGTYSMTLDTKDAAKQSTWFRVTQNAGFSSTWQFQSDDETAIKLESGDLWVATAGVKAPPYSRTLSANGNWNTTDWVDGKTNAFTSVWSDSITKPTGSATLTVTGTNLTMNVDCGVNLDTLKVVTPTNCFPRTFTATGSSALGISALDFREFNGKVIWNPPLASWGTHVYVGTNDVTITSMTSGKGNLQVGALGRATVPEKFAGYDVDKDAFVRFTGTHNFAVSDIPGRGYLSFKNTTLSGGFQNSLIKYVVEDGDTLTFTGDANNYNARMSSSFDIRGGTVTINSNGATTWFGINGETSFRQTNGTFRCTANDTAMSAKNSGFLVGYSSTMTEDFEFDISGGRFEIPNTYINFFGPARFSITSNGVVQAKGVAKGSGNKGVITVNEGTVFEIGSIGLVDGACDFNLYGGTVAGFENGAHTRSTVNLVGVGGFAAKEGTTLTVDGGIATDGATVNIGRTGYAGTVTFTAEPTGVTNYNVVAGTWDLGGMRIPSATVSRIDGTIRIALTLEELLQAAQDGIAVFKTPLDGSAFTNKIKVVTPGGTELLGLCTVSGGNLILRVGYVYPLKAVAQADTAWGDLGWVDSIGMVFYGSWDIVTSAELTNTLNGVVLTAPEDFASTLKVVNTGVLTINGENTLATLDDSLSTGKTTVGFTANNVTAGMRTELGKSGTTLNVANGHYACLANGVTFTTQNVVAGAHVRYDSAAQRTTLGGTVAGAIYSYGNAKFTTNISDYNWILRTEASDAVILGTTQYHMPLDVSGGTLTVGTGGGEYVYGGNNNTGTNSVITVNSGTFKVDLPTSSVNGSNGYRGFIVGGTATVSKHPYVIVNGGTFDSSTSIFAPWEYCTVNLNGGTLKAKGICRGGRTEANLNLNGGVLEIGAGGITKHSSSTGTFNIRLQGSTIRATDNVTLSLAMTASGTSYLQAASGKKLTMGVVPSGTGTLICGDTTNNGTVELTGGSYENLTLGGTFTIRLTTTQQATTLDVALFKAAADLDPANVTVVKSDGTEIAGVKVIKDGKLCWAPASGYMLPVVATVSGTQGWLDLAWKDSSPTPRDVPAEFWTSFTTASVKLIAEGEAKITAPSSAITVATTEVTGEGRLFLPNSANLTLGTVTGDGTIVCDNFCKVYTGLNQSAWTGTYVLTNQSAASGASAGTKLGYTFAGLGNTGSVVEVSDVAGWFDGCSACTETPFKGTEHHYTLKIGPGGLNLNDGSSSQGYCFDKLVGAGNLNVGKASGGPSSRVIVLDATEYTGALSVVGNSGVIIGTPSAVTENGTIAIDGTYVSQGTAKLSAASGVTVRAGGIVNLVGETTQKNWPINASGSLTANGSVKLNGNRVLTRNWKTEGGSIVLKEDAEDYPAILDNAYLWLDATETASITTNASGEVQSWKSVVGDKSAAKYLATGVTAGPTVTENALVGNRVVDFGALGSGKDLSFTRATTIKAVFMVVDIVQAQGAFLLGDGTTFHFHRGSGGNYFSGNPPAEIKTNGKTYRNGVQVADPVNTKIPTGYGLIEVIPQDNSTQICAERICADRNCADSGVYRNGGKKLGELIILTTAPTEAERLAIESYLMGRWGFGYVGTVTSTPAEFTTGAGVDVIGAYHLGSDFTVKNPTVENATFNIGANIYVGAFTVNAAQPLTIAAEGGSVSATSIDDSTSTAKTVLDFATGASSITAGADTVLTTTGTGTITVGANKKVTLYGDAALSRAASSITFSEGTSTYRTGALKFGAEPETAAIALGSAYANLFKTTGKFIIDRALTIDGELVFGNANNVRQYSTFEVGSNAHITATYLHTASGQNYFQGNQNGGVVEITSTGEGDAEGANAVRFGHWNGSSTYNLNYGEMLVAGGIMLGWDSTDGDGTVLNIGAANETKPALVRAASIRGCTSGNANKKAMLKIYPNGVLEVKNGVLMAHQNSTQKQFVMAGGTLRATGDATVALVHADGLKLTAASTLSAKTGNTLTVAAKVTGASPLTIGEADQAGTVKLSGDIAGFTGDVTVTAGTLEVPAGVLKGNVTIAADGILNLSGSTGESTYVVAEGQVTLGTGATVGNIRLNGVPFEGNWELKDGKLIEHYEVISVNIGGGQNGSGASPSDYLVTGDAAVGLEAVPGKHWNNVNGRWGSASSVSIVASKAYNRTEEVTRNSVQVTASANNTYGWGSAATAFFKGYLDDGGAHAHITVSGIPYECYDVIVYGTADSGSMKLAAITVNDTAYTWDSSAQKTVEGTTSWGATQASTPTLGGNALLVKGLTSRDLTIVGGANASGARGGLAAFQIINRAVRITESTGYTATVSDSRDFTAYDWTPSPFVSGPFSYADITVGTYEPVTATIAEDLTLQKLGVTSTANQSLTLAKSAGTVAIGLYDFSAAAGKTVVGFDIGSTPFTVGGGRLVFGGTMNNFDWSAYTDKTIELAGGYSIKADTRLNRSTMILSGTGSTSNNENGLKDGAHLVIPSGTFTLSQRFVVGQGANNQTMHLDITGGTLASGNDGFMYTGGYSGNALHTTLSAGSWTANYIVWNDNGATANTFNIHTFGSGLFAPAFIGTIDGSGNKVANDRDVSAGYRHHVYMGEGGTFSVPAIVPNWLEVVVTNGTGTMTAQTASTVIRSRVTVDAGTTLDFNLGADNTVEFANLTKTNAELVNNGTVKVSSGTFKLAQGVTLTGDIVFVKGSAIDIATDTPEAEEFTVTTGNLTFNGTLKVNGTIKEGVWTGKGGKVIRTELKDFHVTLPEGTASTNFSQIAWDEGAYSNGTNHTVTISAPNGCEIVIDQSITNQSFTVNCTGTCTVRVANDSTVALAQGFLGENYSVFYDNVEYGAVLTTFSVDGSTGWTDNHAVDFYYTLVDPNGLDLVFTGAVDTRSGISVNDVENKGGSVTFSNNLTTVDYFFIGNGTARFATTDQVTIGTLSTYELYNGRIVMAAKTDAAAIKVIDEDDWGVSLEGVTLDIDTFTDAPIPETTNEYQLITAPSIDITGAKLGSSFKGDWELEVVQEGSLQTLVARKTKKGFYFLITDVEIGEEKHTVAYHDAESKDALDIDRDWVAEKAGLTEAEKEDDDEVALAINGEGENGAKLYESYVLGLEPTDETSKPVIAPVQSAVENKVAFRLDNIAVNPRAGANNVTYKVWSGANPGDKTTASQVASYTDPIAVDLPTSGVRYYHIEVLID